MIEDERKNPFLRFQQYLQEGLIVDTKEIKGTVVLRSFTKWYFDFIKNIITAFALVALAIKTHNLALESLSLISTGVLVLYSFSYFWHWRINIFHGLHSARNNDVAGTIVWLMILVVLSIGAQYFLFTLVNAIMQSR